MTVSASVSTGLSPDRLVSFAARGLGRGDQAVDRFGVALDRSAHVRDAEVDVAALVAMGERAAAARRRVGRVSLDEAQEVEERAFAEHVEQQRGVAEVVLLEQRVQRELGGRERVRARAAGERALREDLDVARLVVDVAGEPQRTSA